MTLSKTKNVLNQFSLELVRKLFEMKPYTSFEFDGRIWIKMDPKDVPYYTYSDNYTPFKFKITLNKLTHEIVNLLDKRYGSVTQTTIPIFANEFANDSMSSLLKKLSSRMIFVACDEIGAPTKANTGFGAPRGDKQVRVDFLQIDTVFESGFNMTKEIIDFCANHQAEFDKISDESKTQQPHAFGTFIAALIKDSKPKLSRSSNITISNRALIDVTYNKMIKNSVDFKTGFENATREPVE